MPELSHVPHAPPPLGEVAHLTHSEEPQARFCRSCNREFEEEGFNQHILSSPMHLLTCCIPCKRDFGSEKDRLMHWGTSDTHKYTYDPWCNKNFPCPEAMLNHQRQCPEKHYVCNSCSIDFGPCELDLKKHLEKDGPHKDAYSVKFPEQNLRDKPKNVPICLLCNSNHPSPCHLAQKTLEEFSSLENETQLSADEPNTSNGPRIISEVTEEIFDDPYTRSAMGDNAGVNRDLFLQGQESPNSLALNEVTKRREHSRNWYCKPCKVNFDTKVLLREHIAQHSPLAMACFGCDEEKKFNKFSAMMAHLESGQCPAGLTSRHVNGLVAKHAGSSTILVKDSTRFFLAGPPTRYPLGVNQDHAARIWMCVLCKKSFAAPTSLVTHFKKTGCIRAYPIVLQCPESACTEGFKSFSSLLQHVEVQHDQLLTEIPIADILQYLKDHLGDSSVKEKLGRIEFEMNFKSGKLSLSTIEKDENLSQP